jgi:hypothetical protein
VIKDKRRREAPKALFWQILDLGISRTELTERTMNLRLLNAEEESV